MTELKPQQPFHLEVAIKVANKDFIIKYDKTKSAFRERDILFELDHPFIINLIDTDMVRINLEK